MIDQGSPAHKQARRLVILSALLSLVLLALTGCGGSGSNDEATPDEVRQPPCAVTLDTGPWDVFSGFCQAFDEGGDVTREELQAFTDLASIDAWKQSMEANVPDIRIINWLDDAFHPDRPLEDKKPSKDRALFSQNYQYSRTHRHEIDRHLADFRAENLGCRVLDEAAFWLPDGSRPEALTIVFLPSKPEIRVLEDQIFVDTAVVRAGTNAQLVRQLVGLLFRDRGFLAGPIATGLEGEAAVAHSLRTMMNEGIGGVIEDQTHTMFAPDHPRLGKFNIIPENVFGHGRRAIGMFNLHIPDLVADEKVMLAQGNNLAKTLVASGNLNQGGYCMAACIEAHLGSERLRETIGSPTAFLRAYQEAARLNPVPAPEPHEAMDALHTTMPPFDDAVLDALLDICEKFFPTT